MTDPAAAVVDVDEAATEYVLRGTSIAGRHDLHRDAGPRPVQRERRRRRAWTASVDLRRGRNQFDITAVDPDTGKKSETAVELFITVPFLVIEAPTLTVDQPAEGATFENGAIPVQGTRDERRRRSSSARPIRACRRPPAGAGAATPAPPAGARPRSRSRSPRTARSPRRSS